MTYTTERAAVFALVDRIIKAGFMISVNDGGAFPIKRSTDAKAIKAALFSVDEEHLIVRHADGKLAGTIMLVYGNSPEEVVSDHTDTATIRALVEG